MALPAFRPGRRAAETDPVPGNSRARSGRKEAVARAAASGPHLHRGLPSQALVLCFPCAHLHWAVVQTPMLHPARSVSPGQEAAAGVEGDVPRLTLSQSPSCEWFSLSRTSLEPGWSCLRLLRQHCD